MSDDELYTDEQNELIHERGLKLGDFIVYLSKLDKTDLLRNSPSVITELYWEGLTDEEIKDGN